MSLIGWARRSFDIPRWWRSGAYALSGIGSTLATQSAVWFHISVLAAFGGAALWLQISLADWRWLVLGWACVLAAEAANTGLEHLCDRVSATPDEAVRKAKDCAAGAVLLAAFGAWITAGLTLWPYLAARLG